MHVGGYNKKPDYPRLGPSLLIAASVILAIRTAKWGARQEGTASDRDLDKEVEHAITLANLVLTALLQKKASLFPSQDVPWYVATEEDVPK